MDTRKIGDTYWIEVVGRTWKPAASNKFAIVHCRGNGFELYDYRQGLPAKGQWFKTFAQAAQATNA